MADLHTYRAYGLRFLSELSIPELKEDSGPPDVIIRTGKVPAELSNPVVEGSCVQASQQEFLLRLTNVACYHVVRGWEITVELLSKADNPDIRLFLLGSVFGALLQQRGLLLLHGASVEKGGRSVLFTGNSGTGKSTLAAALIGKGFRILTDDVCAVLMGNDGLPYVLPGFPGLKLWRDAAEKLGWRVDGLFPVRNDMEKYRVEVEKHYCNTEAVLRQLYVINNREGDGIEIDRIRDFAKLETLILNTYRYCFLNGQTMKTLHFRQCAAVAAKIDIFSVRRPKNGFRIKELALSVEINMESRHGQAYGIQEE